MVTGPIPTATASQLTGKMALIQGQAIPGIAEYYVYRGIQDIGFAKIIKQYEKDGTFAGHWHKYETKLIPGFDYKQFYLRISENLPDWAFYYISPKNKNNLLEGPALLNKGVKTFVGS